MNLFKTALVALIAAMGVAVAVPATSAPQTAEIAPPSGAPAGNLSVSPTSFYAGEPVQLSANFPSGRFDVRLYEETSPGSGDFEPVAVDESNKNGNAYFDGYVAAGPRQVFAQTEDGRHTAVLALEPATPDPSGPPAGHLSTVPTIFYGGQKVQLAANFPSGVFDVRFFKETALGSGAFELIGTDESNKNGNAYLNGYAVLGNQAIFAETEDGRHTALTTLVPKLPDVSGSPTGELSTEPRRPSIGQKITLKATFLYHCRQKTVNFFRMTEAGVYGQYLGSARATDTVGTRSAAAYLRNFKLTEYMKVVAVTEGSCGGTSGTVERTDSDGIP